MELQIPPLRERKEDILWLAGRLLDAEAAQGRKPRRSLSPAAEHALLDYPWPGNIRELKHCLGRACVLSSQAVLTKELLFAGHAPEVDATLAPSLGDYLETHERRYIEEALRTKSGRIAETAAALGISRKNLWEKMKKLNLN